MWIKQFDTILADSIIDELVREMTTREFIRVFVAYKSKNGAGRKKNRWSRTNQAFITSHAKFTPNTQGRLLMYLFNLYISGCWIYNFKRKKYEMKYPRRRYRFPTTLKLVIR